MNKRYSEIPTIGWIPKEYNMKFNKKELSVEITASDGEPITEWEKIRVYKYMSLLQ